jgi:hypothetical protein
MKSRLTGVQLQARAQAGLRRDLNAMYRQMVNEMSALLLRYGIGDNSTIPSARHDDVAEEIGLIHRKYFVGMMGRKSFDDNGLAITPYARILQKWYVYAVVGAIRLDRVWMKQHLPEDVYNWLARTSRKTLARGAQMQEAENPYARRPDEDGEEYRARLIKDLYIVHDNPLAEIDPSRKWVPFTRWQDDKGYRLSDRLWRGEQRAHDKIDEILMRELRNNMGSLRLSRLLEQFLLPERAGVKTNKPYNVTASFDAMRLARTEITRAYNQAAYTSALLNPYVNSIDVVRSSNGDADCDICPQHATIDGQGNRIRPPYDQNTAHVGPFHPNCRCRVSPVPADTPEQITQNLRAFMAFDPAIEPAPTAATDNLIDAMLGPALVGLWRQNRL